MDLHYFRHPGRRSIVLGGAISMCLGRLSATYGSVCAKISTAQFFSENYGYSGFDGVKQIHGFTGTQGTPPLQPIG